MTFEEESLIIPESNGDVDVDILCEAGSIVTTQKIIDKYFTKKIGIDYGNGKDKSIINGKVVLSFEEQFPSLCCRFMQMPNGIKLRSELDIIDTCRDNKRIKEAIEKHRECPTVGNYECKIDANLNCVDVILKELRL